MPPDSGSTDDDGSNMTTVSAQVAEHKKADWEAAVEDGEEYSSLSDLIRVSVTTELSDSYIHESEAFDPDSLDIDFDSDELLEDLDKRFDELHDRLDRLASTAPEASDDTSLRNDIMEWVPSLPTVELCKEHIMNRTDEQGNLESEVVESGDVGRPLASSARLANFLDADENEVREEMYRIEKGSSRFRTFREGGETWMFEITDQ